MKNEFIPKYKSIYDKDVQPSKRFTPHIKNPKREEKEIYSSEDYRPLK